MPAMPEFTICAAAQGDFEQWRQLWQGYNDFYERQIPDAVTRMTWSRFFDAYEPVHALVALRGSELIGLPHFLYHRNTAMISPTCYLQDLFTSAASRGHGVGRALIGAVARSAREAGAPRLYWMTHETNANARRLYDLVAERSGFIQYRMNLS
jgi:GNAT superfamily N-acetyltransferase